MGRQVRQYLLPLGGAGNKHYGGTEAVWANLVFALLHDMADKHPFDGVDLRRYPERYQIGRGEYGVFHAEPYKTQLLPLWRFRTPADARASSDAIYVKFCQYREQGDFVGMDVARKYLQMGYTRSRRYAKYAGGKKYGPTGEPLPVDHLDPAKAESAAIFHAAWQQAQDDPVYVRLKSEFQTRKQNRI